MNGIYRGVRRFLEDEGGITAVEFALIVALIAVLIVVAATSSGTRLSCTLIRVAGCIFNQSGATCSQACP